MKNLNSCPVCQNELPKVSVLFMDATRVCDHCHHQIQTKFLIRVFAWFVSVIALMALAKFIGNLSGFFMWFIINGVIYVLTLFFGYDSKALSEEDYLKIKEKLNELDSQGFYKNQQALKIGVRDLGFSTFFYILPSVLYHLNFIRLNQMFYVEGISFAFAFLFIVSILLYLFKDKWYYRIALNKIKFIPLIISIVFIGHLLNVMLSTLIYDAYQIYFELYLSKLIQSILVLLILQVLIVKKTNLK